MYDFKLEDERKDQFKKVNEDFRYKFLNSKGYVLKITNSWRVSCVFMEIFDQELL